MTTVAVLADPPYDGFVLPTLAETTPLSAAEAADLYRAMLGDVCRAVEASGGDLLVNYRPDDQVPEEYGDTPAETAVRDAVAGALADPESARFEVQVGSMFAARVGNTITHLLEREGVDTAAAVEPTAALLGRQAVDAAAMKLRSSEVVLGPAPGGRVYYAGFREPIDFADAYAQPAVETLTDRALEAGHDVDFLEMQPVIETAADLRTVLPVLRARRRAGRLVPERTAEFLEEIGLSVVERDGTLSLARDATDRS